uniref:Uncharacterized protein n=1 Tax=Panagrolaimus davidi TaxID=227884 RepID=A0A914PCY1_9BILA
MISGTSRTFINFLNESSIPLQKYLRAMGFVQSFPIQGYAFFENWRDDSCPFESISRKKSFKFSDDTEMVYIQSAFISQSLSQFENPRSNKQSLRKNACRWRFKAPYGFGFKVVVTRSLLKPNTDLLIENTTDVIVDCTNVKENHPYYNNDNYIEINLSAASPNVLTLMELQIAISIEKLNATKTKGNCITATENNITVWYSVGYNSTGYDNNIRCSHTEIMDSDFEILVSIVSYRVETRFF